MERRDFLRTSLMGGAALASGAARVESATEAPAQASPASFELEEITIAELQRGMETGKFTSRSITEQYLARIEELDRQGPALRAILETNPDAPAIADALDQERRAKGPRGPLHGIPVLLKDNIDTADRMTTTAGSLALAGSIPPQDSGVAKKLRAAGAVLIGKANLSEWANIRSDHSSSGWSGRGGQCRNPYALDRNPCGSSSGSGVAVSANLAPVAIGTETDGSIVCPSNANGLVGLKPTVGWVSRAGIIPISHSQDTAGPMTRTVADAAVVFTAILGIDPRDPATAVLDKVVPSDYTKFLNANGLRGARLGVARKFFGFLPAVDKIMEAALAEMKKQGAVLVDPVEVPMDKEFGDAELLVLLYELKADLNAYLKSLGPNAPVKTLAEIIEFNEKHREQEMPYFGQELFIKAEAKGPLSSKEYLTALKKNQRLLRKKGIDATMNKHRLDAIVAPTGGPAWVTDLVNGDHFSGGCSGPPAVAGYPHITVPAGFVRGLPVGISFFGRAWSESVLIRLAYAYEQATHFRQAPKFRSTAEL
ncbi:MAG: amidase [Acidobacteria bacterium]|nr:amidase [Acidobacteriota bacterium]MCL5287161.1 amidase [Acidobacteriota bacterium]